jgi:hypothetical protein
MTSEHLENTSPDSTRQYVITPAAGKRLIAKGVAAMPVVQAALRANTVAIIAGTTNGYIAEEVLSALGEKGFPRRHFVRGITVPPARPTTEMGRLPDESGFPGDVVIEKGVWQKGKTIYDVVDQLKEGDVVVKGANALDVERKRAAILIGHPQGGVIGTVLPAVVGRRVELILAVGLEKRIPGSLDEAAILVNAPGARGLRLLPVPGTVFTELDAVELLTGARAMVVAAGGVFGAEGCVWLAVSGSPAQVDCAGKLLKEISPERMWSDGFSKPA